MEETETKYIITTPKQTLQFIVDNPVYLAKDFYICITIIELCERGIISADTEALTTTLINKNRPSSTKFTKYYKGKFYNRNCVRSFWNNWNNTPQQRHQIIQTKLLYLKDLILTL